MIDYESIMEKISFTGVRDFYKTRELVSIIRSRMPNGNSKNFFGKIMLQPKTKYAAGIYLRCKDPKYAAMANGEKCNFKVFYRKCPDGIFRLRKDSERTSFICTCNHEGVVNKKDDFDQYKDVIDEVNEFDKDSPGIVALPLIKIPQIKDREVKAEELVNDFNSNSSSIPNGNRHSSRTRSNLDTSLKNDNKQLPERSIRAPRLRRYVEADSEDNDDDESDSDSNMDSYSNHVDKKRKTVSSATPNKRKIQQHKDVSVAADSSVGTSGTLNSKRIEGLDFGPICKRIFFTAGAEAKSQRLREAANKEFLKLGVDKSFTFKVGVGRLKNDFTADNLYLRCQRKFGHNPDCTFKVCFKRDKKTDIWAVTTDSSNTSFICKCEDFGNNANAIIDILSRKAPNSNDNKKIKDSGLIENKKNLNGTSTTPEPLKQKTQSYNGTVIATIKTNPEKTLSNKNTNNKQVKATLQNTGSLEAVCKKINIVIEKKVKLTRKEIHPIFEKYLEQYGIKRRFSLVFMCNGKIPDTIIVNFLSDVEDENKYSKYFGNACKLSACFQRDSKTYKKFNFIPLSVKTNFDCSCKTCAKFKAHSSSASNNGTADTNGKYLKTSETKKPLIMPIGYNDSHKSGLPLHDASTCSKCSQYNQATKEINALMTLNSNLYITYLI
ncbi:hypothetical protein HANVADRAFT_54301, partial [Hanseniaspora valbyensis NRRL Y-1626]